MPTPSVSAPGFLHSTGRVQGALAPAAGPRCALIWVQDRDNLLSSDEHWAKAQAATEEARRQAKLVEAGARSHREAYDEYYKAERHAQKTKHTVEEIEVPFPPLATAVASCHSLEWSSSHVA